MQKKKVTFVINDFTVGGAQRVTANILEKLDRNTLDLSLIVLFHFPKWANMTALIPTDVPVTFLDFKGFKDWHNLLALYKTLKKIKPDVVVANLFFSNTLIRILKPLVGYAVLIVEHNTYIGKRGWEKRVDKILSRVTYRIIAVSDTVKTFTAKQERISLSKFVVIENGLDVKGLAAKVAVKSKSEWRTELGLTTRNILLSVARFVPQKNLELLIEGFAEFTLANNDWDLIIVGEGVTLSKLQQRTQELGIEDRVYFAGNQTDVYKFYGAADLFISTSRIEGFGIAHAEALACGVPVVTTRTAGPDKYIKQGVNGYFIDNETPTGVAQALYEIDRADLHTMDIAARASMIPYDITNTAAQYENLIVEATTKRR